MKTFLGFNILSFLAGLVIVIILGEWVKAIVIGITKKIKVDPPKGVDKQKWASLVSNDTNEGGDGASYIGKLERMLFYLALVIKTPELILGWFAFKVASKWETWNNLIKVPNYLKNRNDLDYLLARKRWGTKTYQRFLIGTLLNLFAGLIGYAFYVFLKDLIGLGFFFQRFR